ncbi:MmcQ/YjbR family DNA-binding protein [Actinomycetospora straminea]|uniref:MmcQ/YjbR family DNA-binding protein n=1 Tax=Actinomycetospora straminea TaxID=663607 RepID=A0ABP9DRK4_9PSEU|nr:MmcQ/YjbR family DNA-binding protein [Actinomycetospora straminea]MDD7935890.1 MmcQ/YjbR family DNA-binding protein [Actinomycetospora straminea]
MATLDDVRRLALALPRTSEKVSWGSASWVVSSKGFVWERPLRRADEAALAEAGVPLPEGDVLGVHVADEGVKHALVADDPDVYFTTPHFDGYPAVLVRLERIGVDELRELVEEAWLLRAPKTVARAWLADQGR